MLRVCWKWISSYYIIYEILQIECQKHCFLDSFLEERLYVIQPEGFDNPEER